MIDNNSKGQTEKLGENPKKCRYKFQNRPILRFLRQVQNSQNT